VKALFRPTTEADMVEWQASLIERGSSLTHVDAIVMGIDQYTVYIYIIYTPTDAVCCPDINIEDIALSNMIGEIAENTAYIYIRNVFQFRVQSFQSPGFRA